MPSKVDPCLFIKGSVLLVLYTDDSAFFSPSAQAVDDEIASLKKAFDLTDEGELQDYLGTHFICHTDGRMELQQQKSVDNCLNQLGMGKTKKMSNSMTPQQNCPRSYMPIQMAQIANRFGTSVLSWDA